MKKVKNKIISISGEPVTGKGTNIKRIKQKLIERGYTEDNIHIISTGHEFRAYFKEVLKYIANIENDEVLKDIYNNGKIRNIIHNPEYRKSFIELIAKLGTKKLPEDISIEQANNMQELAQIRALIDTVVDEELERKGKEINEEQRLDEVWIVDSRLGFKNIPDSFSVRLTCQPEIAGERLFNDNSRGDEDNNYKSIEEAIEQREKRRLGEISRYKQRYGVDLTDESNYNLIIDTSFSNVDDISNVILTCLDRYQNDEFIPKMWASPKQMLPMQGERATYGKGTSGLSFEELSNLIKTNGYDQNYPIKIVEVNGEKYIIEGHHRNFGTAYVGISIVPYEVLAKDNECLPKKYYGGCKAKDISNGLQAINLTGHEMFLDKINNSFFSYNNVYSGIYSRLKNRDKDKNEIEID